LNKVLSGKGPFTVFAPTNDAFDALKHKLGGTLPSGDALKRVLLYHVALTRVSAAQLLTAGFVKTALGQDVTAKTVGDKVVLNGSVNVLIADIGASNGVIHAIDAVLLPSDPK
jgi:transforming growth factor-beta-induced protein